MGCSPSSSTWRLMSQMKMRCGACNFDVFLSFCPLTTTARVYTSTARCMPCPGYATALTGTRRAPDIRIIDNLCHSCRNPSQWQYVVLRAPVSSDSALMLALLHCMVHSGAADLQPSVLRFTRRWQEQELFVWSPNLSTTRRSRPLRQVVYSC